jgi:UPF0271 protein
VAIARKFGMRVWEEAFADRKYQRDGSLLPRSKTGACLSNLQEIARRAEQLKQSGRITIHGRKSLQLAPATLCVHSDTPGAVKIARLCRAILEEKL